MRHEHNDPRELSTGILATGRLSLVFHYTQVKITVNPRAPLNMLQPLPEIPPANDPIGHSGVRKMRFTQIISV